MKRQLPFFLVFLLLASFASGCGYRALGQVSDQEVIALQISSRASEPGLALALRGALEASLRRRGLRWTQSDQIHLPSLSLIVAPSPALPGGPRLEGGALSSQVRGLVVVVEAKWVDLEGVSPKVFKAHAHYDERLTGFGSAESRGSGQDDAISELSEQIADWVVLELMEQGWEEQSKRKRGPSLER